MSKEKVNEFLSTIGQDQVQQEAIKKAVADVDDPAAAVVAAASERGFDFTAEEFVEVIDEIQKSELGDEELNAVAGGAQRPGGKEKIAAQGPAIIDRSIDWLGLRY